MQTAVEHTEADSQLVLDGLSDLRKEVRKNSVKLESVENLIESGLSDINARVNQTEWTIKDVGNDIAARLTLIQNDTRTIASSNLVAADAVTELLTKMDMQSAMISEMVLASATILHHH